jgi:N-acetylglucosamine-6-phosphate deacetylase
MVRLSTNRVVLAASFLTNMTVCATGLATVAKGILKHGVTGFCPTLVTNTAAMYRDFLHHCRRTSGGPDGAAILGAHCEGPFINPLKKGAHPEHVRVTLSCKGVNF